MQSERQPEILARVQGLTMVLEGYADVVVERLGGRLLTDFARIHEALQRHHVERGEAERFIEQLLGLRLDREHYERGETFCRGVIERAGLEGLNRALGVRAHAPDPQRARRAGPLARAHRPPRSRVAAGDSSTLGRGILATCLTMCTRYSGWYFFFDTGASPGVSAGRV